MKKFAPLTFHFHKKTKSNGTCMHFYVTQLRRIRMERPRVPLLVLGTVGVLTQSMISFAQPTCRMPNLS